MPLVAAQAHEMLAVLKQKETGEVDLQRLHLASRTGPPNWAIEKRFVKVLDEAGATERAIAELKHCLSTQWYRAETWQLLNVLLAKTGKQTEAAEALRQAHLYDVRLEERTTAP
jgi:predicted Zn-dependent protease